MNHIYIYIYIYIYICVCVCVCACVELIGKKLRVANIVDSISTLY